jgi:hypothetical protein
MVKKKAYPPLAPDRLMRQLSDITIYEAKQILEGVAQEYLLTEVVIIDWAAQVARRKTTISAEYHVVWNHYDFATDVRVEFVGGPPGAAKWYSGTLLTYVCDRILYHASVYTSHSVIHVLKPYGFTMERNHGKRCADGSYVQV